MSLSDFDFEEQVKQENAKDWMSRATVYAHLQGMLEGMAVLGSDPFRLPLRLSPGDGVVCIVDPAICIRIAEHLGYGFRIICGPSSNYVLSNGQPCPICSSTFASQEMRLRFRWLMPCQVYATLGEKGWRWYKNAEFSILRWLEIDERLLHKLVRCNFLRAGLQLERTADWGWISKPEPRLGQWSEHDQRRLRRDIPAPGVRLPTEETVAEAIKVAEANWHHSPQPGRTAEVLRWLPQGAVVVPCHFASKKPRVFWKALWSAEEFAKYGTERADNGNLAVKVGPADVRTFDWDTDAFFQEFVRVNPWAEKAQQSFGARGGNVWCRIKLPPDQEKCWLLEYVANNAKVEKAGEFRAGNCLTTISGAHPSGVLYRVSNPGKLPMIQAEDVCWPDGVRLHEQTVRRPGDYDDTPGDIGLDLSKVEGLHDHPRHPGSLEGRCPVCACAGKDRNCDNLEIWPSGAFKCIADCDSTEIFALIDRRRGWRPKPGNETARGRSHRRRISRPVRYDISQSSNR